MIHRAIRVHGWTVDFLFAHRRNDPDGVLAVLRSYGAPASLVEQADDLMNSGPNCGFTFSNSDRRLCLTWVGPQTEGAEWVNTTVHEIVHVAIAVSDQADALAAARVADKLLELRGVDASFTLVSVGDTIHVSGRSNGKVNVQHILETLGGGGRFEEAGAQVRETDLQGAAVSLRTPQRGEKHDSGIHGAHQI